MKNLGDKIASIANPVAKTLDWAFNTDLHGCTGCKQMQQNLNSGMTLGQAVYERFFNKQKGDKMKFIVTRQVAIEAESVEEAMEKTKPTEGTTSTISVSPYRETVQPGARPGMQVAPHTPAKSA